MKIRLPGNLLLTGEYVILEEGGQGISLAPDYSYFLESRAQDSWEILSLFPQGTKTWEKGENPFLDILLGHLQEIFPQAPAQKILLDSSGLYSQGRKLGLGSSACTAAALYALFFALHHNKKPQAKEVAQGAVEAHRLAQGGRGSGYDVLTSLYGGIGLFTGGTTPSFQPLDFLPPPLFLFWGPKSVDTREAIQKWRSFCEQEPLSWEHMKKAHQRIITLGQKGQWHEFFSQAKLWGLELGETIGIRAEFHPPPSIAPEKTKALGAGNEIALTWGTSERPDGSTPMALSPQGLQWL